MYKTNGNAAYLTLSLSLTMHVDDNTLLKMLPAQCKVVTGLCVTPLKQLSFTSG